MLWKPTSEAALDQHCCGRLSSALTLWPSTEVWSINETKACGRHLVTLACKAPLIWVFSSICPTSSTSCLKHQEELRLHSSRERRLVNKRKHHSPFVRRHGYPRGDLFHPLALEYMYISHLSPYSPTFLPNSLASLWSSHCLLQCVCCSMPSQRPQLSCPQAWRRTCRGGGRRGRGSL